jgi:large subunit ribosomal protein L6
MLKVSSFSFVSNIKLYILKKQKVLLFCAIDKKIYINLQLRLKKNDLGLKCLPIYNVKNNSFNSIYKVMLNQIWIGLAFGYRKQLNLIGIGYTVKKENNILYFKLGYSHNVFVKLPNSIIALSPRPRKLILKSIFLHELATFVCIIQNLKKPNPYKRLGIYLKHQKVTIKQGKKA